MNFDEKQQEKVNLRVGDEQVLKEQPAAETVESYVLGETLGAGTTGISRKAVNRTDGTEVVIKILKMHSAHKATFDKRLKIELETAKNLAHPSIIPTIDNGQMPDGAPYIVTEYIDDPTLFDVLHATANLTKTQLLGYLIGACESFAHAHEMGVVHRKISSRKIFVSSTPIDGTQIRTTGYGTNWVGDSRKADPQIDVFAFGSLIEEAFMGKSMPPEVQNIVAFCTAEPSSRYSDCREVLKNLLLVNEGKLPNPPSNRAGQQMMKPLIVAAVVIVTILITAFSFNFSNQPKVAQDPGIGNPTTQSAAPKPIDLEIPATDTPVQSTTQAPFILPSAQPNSKGLSKDAVKSAAGAAAAIGVARYKSMSPEDKAKAKSAAIESTKTAVKKWQGLDEGSKEKWKNRATGAAGKAASFWKKLPKGN